MKRAALVVGGTGPTGPYVVDGLLDRGYAVTILHTGRHEVESISARVDHLHVDPFDANAVGEGLGSSTFDLAVVMYGRTRDLARVLHGKIGKLVSVGGVPVYNGYGMPHLLRPKGLRVPTRESSPLARAPLSDLPLNRKVRKIVESEAVVFDRHPSASHFRYPLIYGPRQRMPREWMIVRRILDGRRSIILPDGGLSLRTAAFSENAAAALMSAVDHPDRSGGNAYNVSDEWTPTLAQLVELIGTALGQELQIVSMPFELARPAYPLVMAVDPYHRILPVDKALYELGYRDVVPVEEAIAETARWLVDNQPSGDGPVSDGDPFAYEAEDRLIAAWTTAVEGVRPAAMAADTGYVNRYSDGFAV